jgi:KDO2-lipid IV(A) lauroyltransferase
MRTTKYFFQFILILALLIIFKISGLKISRFMSSRISLIFGKFIRSTKIIESNISFVFPNSDKKFQEIITKNMWKTYGKILAEYIFIKCFRKDMSEKYIKVKGGEILENIKFTKTPVIFISGHFDNFELMAMQIEKSGVDVAAIYRPLNNFFLNPLMEYIRKKYICKKQIKKGVAGTKEILKYFKSGTSVALMIDQRVSQGIKSMFFRKIALTTTLPAQFVKKFNCKIVPIYIERTMNENFILSVNKPISFDKNKTINDITLEINQILEKMILNNPNQWIWSHNRWKL